MPTVVLLDVSLSMARCGVPENSINPEEKAVKEESDTTTTTTTTNTGIGASKKALAVHSLYKFLEYLGAQSRLEYVSLVVFSSLWECMVPFTRDYDLIKAAADSIVLYDKTCIQGAFAATKEVFQSAWGSSMPAKVLIITDGSINASCSVQEKVSAIQFPFPCELHFLTVSSPEEFCCPTELLNLKNLAEHVGGSVVMPDSPPTFQSIDTLVQRLVSRHYKSYNGTLKCGNLKSNVLLFPPPTIYIKQNDFIHEELEFPHDIHIIGFLSMANTRSPAYVTRHLVLPLKEHPGTGNDADDKNSDGHSPACTVLLHGALKVESAVAIVRLRDDWYGMMYSWADSRKKSNLVLSVFHPGTDSVPWLGNLANLTLPNQVSFPGMDVQPTSGLPVQISERKSYSNMQPSWLRQASLQADVQKLLRYGRKLPEKLNIFYKELNRIRKSAVSLGFLSLLSGLAQILERECTLLPSSTHPDASMQLEHAAGILRSSRVNDVDYVIQPI